MFEKLKIYLGLESLQDKLNRYESVEKSFKEVDERLNELAKSFYFEKCMFANRMKDPDNYSIQDKIRQKFDIFLSSHKEDIRKAKRECDSLKKEKEKIESDERIQKALKEIRKSEQYQKIKKSYQNRSISLDTFNTIIKSVTKEEKIKYADFILFNQEGKLLLLKRSSWEDDNKGAWVIPGGHVDPGEDFESAAKRELREESGYNVDKCENVGSYEDENCHIEYFQATVDTREHEAVLDVFESRDLRWIDMSEIWDYDFIFNMKDNLLKILKLPTKQKEIIKKTISKSEVEDLILKGINHKYIRKEPNGKGGWDYIYEEEKSDNTTKSDIEKLKNSKSWEIKEGISFLDKDGNNQSDMNNLSEEERRFVVGYLTHSYGKINKELMSGEVSDDVKLYVKYLKNSISKLNDYKGEVHRTISFDTLGKISGKKAMEKTLNYYKENKGKEITEKGFISTGENKNKVRKRFSGNTSINFQITSKSGKDLRKYNQEEKEVLFDSGSKFKVISVSGNNVKLEQVENLNKAYLNLFFELNKLEAKKNFLIEKGFLEEAGLINNDIEKAKKDISKLNKIKKLIYRDGKLIFATYYTKQDQTLEDEEKTSSAGVITEDIVQGEFIEIETKKKKISGYIAGFSYRKDGENWIHVYTDNDKWECIKVSSIKSYNKKLSEDKKEDKSEYNEFGYKFVKDLGGSTGAKLYENVLGDKVVRKTGKDKEHLKIELAALKLYDYFDVKVPKVVDYNENELYTKYLEKYNELSLKENSDYNNHKFKREVEDKFGVDILLANWDVIGLEDDNVILAYNEHYNGSFYRVDVGGSLTKRAQGKDKEFGAEVKEIETMLDPNINPKTAEYFKNVNLNMVLKSAVDRYETIESLINADKSIPEDIKKTLKERTEYIKSYVNKQYESKVDEIVYKGDLYTFEGDIDDEIATEKINKFYSKLNEDLKITVNDVKQIESNDYFSGDHLKEFVEKYKDNELFKEAKKLGLTDVEIKIINDYTGSSTIYNDLAKSYVDSVTGNINFNKFSVDLEGGGDKSVEKIEKVEIDLNDYLNPIVNAIKSLNFTKASGNKSVQMNGDKYASAKEAQKNILDLKDNIVNDKITVSDKENTIKRLDKINELYKSFDNSYLNDIKHPFVDTSDYYLGEKIYKEVKTKSEPVDPGFKYNGFEGRNGFFVAKLKFLCNALTKLEKSRNPKFYKKQVFHRGIDLNNKEEKRLQFKKEHSTTNDYVMHQWGSSSSFKSFGFASSRDTVLKIEGEGIWINDISQYKGEEESEVLIRPFTLYRNIMYMEKERDEDAPYHLQGKRIVALRKIN